MVRERKGQTVLIVGCQVEGHTHLYVFKPHQRYDVLAAITRDVFNPKLNLNQLDAMAMGLEVHRLCRLEEE